MTLGGITSGGLAGGGTIPGGFGGCRGGNSGGGKGMSESVGSDELAGGEDPAQVVTVAGGEDSAQDQAPVEMVLDVAGRSRVGCEFRVRLPETMILIWK